ncbi:MAG: DUF2726 domain-containing protein [Candidatus Buchananbacteria bacterium]
MDKFLLVVISFFVLEIIFYLFQDKLLVLIKLTAHDLPFKRKEFLMNIPERKFFEELTKITPNNYVVFPQVVLGSVVETTVPRSKAMGWRNKIDRKTIDFVIFELPYYQPVLAIEYDGKTHNYPDRKKRDSEVKKILDTSGIKNFHVKHSYNINFEEIKNKIDEILLNKNC